MKPNDYARLELLELRNRGYVTPHCKSALDVGCGGGEFVCALRNMEWDAIGIDPQVFHAACKRYDRTPQAPLDHRGHGKLYF
jgi:hypothetical protein